MQRKTFPIRDGFEAKCMEVGFDFHSMPSTDGTAYWQEGVAYEFSEATIDAIDDATADLYQRCMEHVDAVVTSGDYPGAYGLDEREISLIENSWRNQEHDLYGRFDLATDGSAIKMLEFNGDTPTGLLEASIVQWHWLEDMMGSDSRNQFNSIHEKLIQSWPVITSRLTSGARVYFAASDEGGREDWGNLEYLADTCTQAGHDVSLIAMEKIGWDAAMRTYVDESNRPIEAVFKLYPWEWLSREEFGQHLPKAKTRWIEPAWKMLLSNKALLPLLWQRFPGHPNLLEAYFAGKEGPTTGNWVKKPLLAREGANITKLVAGQVVPVTGSVFHEAYDNSGYVYQRWFDLPVFEGFRPLVGSWIVGGQTAGIGIREDNNEVTGNSSHFVPHYFN
jgi:glutathionylspermidine synthase